MARLCCSLIVLAGFVAAPLLQAQIKESDIEKEIGNLRSLSADQRPQATLKLAQEIRTLPAGTQKVKDADSLANLSTEGDPGAETLQAVADTLAQSLKETPVPAKGDQTPEPYVELAKLVRYEGVTASLDDPLFAKAGKLLEANEADVQKADFTLRDTQYQKVTLSQFRGKVVLVNFWATWCPPCREEMPNLDTIYTHYQSLGLVILSITDEDSTKIDPLIAKWGYHPPVLLDPGGKVHKMFHVSGIPTTFVFDRDGKLVAEAMDERTQRQFLQMLAKAGLHN